MANKKTVSEYPRTRVVWFTTNAFGSDGKAIITLQQILDVIAKHAASIKRYAVEKHDKDVHDEESIADRNNRRSRLYLEVYGDYAREMGLAEDRGTPDAPNPSGYVYNAECVQKTKFYVNNVCPEKKPGDLKELHFHVALEFKNARRIDQIARWFNLPVNLFDKVSGRHGFEDCAEYLVHAKQPEKYQYDPKTVKANFNYPEWLENEKLLEIQHQKYRMSKDAFRDIVQQVCDGKLTLRQAKEAVSDPIYLENESLFIKARNEYLYHHVSMPVPRQVFYIDTTVDPKTGVSRSGFGKTICSQALAKMFAKQYMPEGHEKELLKKPISELSDYIFSVGSKGVAWQRYDGQPIVLIDDRTGEDMLHEFGGSEGVKTLLDPFPEKHSEHRKYGDVCIVARYIIINGIVPAGTFFRQLAYAKKEPTNQFSRRVPFLVTLMTEEQIAMYFNKGVFDDTGETEKYEVIQTRKASFKKLKETVSNNNRFEVEHSILEPVEAKSIEYDKKKKEEHKAQSYDEIPEDVKHYGEPGDIPVPQIIDINDEDPFNPHHDRTLPDYWHYNLMNYFEGKLSRDDFKNWALLSGMSEDDFATELSIAESENSAIGY